MYIKKCKFCDKNEFKNQQQHSSHHIYCLSNPDRKKNILRCINTGKKTRIERKIYKLYCKTCGNEYTTSCLESEFKRNKHRITCSLKCGKTHIRTEEQKRKLSEILKNSEKQKIAAKISGEKRKGFYFGGGKQKLKFETIKTKCEYCNNDIEHKINIKRKFHKECWLKVCGGFRENSTIKHREKYNGYWMDSGTEKRFAILLDLNKIKWIKNKEKYYEYFDLKNKKRKYYPDFYLPDYDYWVEIKSKYYETENDVLKLQSVGNNIEMIYDHDLKLPKIIYQINA